MNLTMNPIALAAWVLLLIFGAIFMAFFWFDSLSHRVRNWRSRRRREHRAWANDGLDKFRFGVLVRLGSCWIGVHWSGHYKRICFNPVPFVTVWIALPGGVAP